MASSLSNFEPCHMASDVKRVLRAAVRETQQRNRELGVPNVVDIDGTTYYELPSGELTRTPPEGFGQRQ